MSIENVQDGASIESLNAEDVKTLKNGIKELSDELLQISAHREQIKSIIDTVHEKTNVNKKLIRKLAKTYNNSSFKEEQDENSRFEELYTRIVNVV